MSKPKNLARMAIFELALLAVCWAVAAANPRTGKRLVEWSLRTLPGPEWYSLHND